MAESSVRSSAVGQQSLRVAALEHKRALPRALMGGTSAMRAAGEMFMPRHKSETATVYSTRLNSTTLFNAFKDCVLKQVGKLFSQPIICNDDVPPMLVTLCENIDGQGRAVTPFGMDVLTHAMVDGVAYILVDAPHVEEREDEEGANPSLVTMADQIAQGVRPYCVLVTAGQVLGWRSEDVGGVHKVTQLRIRECSVEEDGDYGEREVERVRVLYPGGYEVWERVRVAGQATVEYQLIETGSTTLTDIPIVPVYTNRTAFMEGEPPLSALAELNAEHWVSSSENRHALTYSRFAMLAFTGFSKEEILAVEVGPAKGIPVPQGGSVEYIEHTGAGINAGFADIDRIEKRMESAGMTTRIEGAGSVTATTSAINSAESNAALKAIAQGLEDSLAQVLQYMAQLSSESNGGTVEVYDAFAEEAPQGTVDELLKLRANRDLSRPTLWDILKGRGVLPEDFDAAAEAAKIESDIGTDMGPPPAAGQFGMAMRGALAGSGFPTE